MRDTYPALSFGRGKANGKWKMETGNWEMGNGKMERKEEKRGLRFRIACDLARVSVRVALGYQH